jgi:hypothetical protein
VTREELKNRIWPTEFHFEFEHGLNNAIHRIREALGDARDALETRRGLHREVVVAAERCARRRPPSAGALLAVFDRSSGVSRDESIPGTSRAREHSIKRPDA